MLAGGVRLRLPAGAEPNLSLILGGGGTTLKSWWAPTGRWRAAACRGVPGCGRSSPGGVPYDERRSRLDCPGHPGSGGTPTARSMNRAIRAAAGLEDRHQFRFPRCLVGRRDRQMDDRRVGRSSGRHPNPGFSAPMWRRRCYRTSSRPCRKARRNPDPARHGASRRDVLAAGLPVGSGPTDACPEQRAAWALNDTVPPSFAGYADVTRPLRLGGVSAGAVLRPVPGSRQVALDVDAQGAEGEVWWMLDGRVVNHGAAAHPFKLVLAQDGRYTLTVMDTKGRHDSVVLKSLVLRHDRHRI